MPVAQPEPAGFSSVTPILRHTIPAPDIAQTCPGTWPTDMWRNPCLAFNTETSTKEEVNIDILKNLFIICYKKLVNEVGKKLKLTKR